MRWFRLCIFYAEFSALSHSITTPIFITIQLNEAEILRKRCGKQWRDFLMLNGISKEWILLITCSDMTQNCETAQFHIVWKYSVQNSKKLVKSETTLVWHLGWYPPRLWGCFPSGKFKIAALNWISPRENSPIASGGIIPDVTLVSLTFHSFFVFFTEYFSNNVENS